MNKNVKVISSVLAAAMAVSVVPAMNVSAADLTKITLTMQSLQRLLLRKDSEIRPMTEYI